MREIVHKALALYGNKVDGSSETVEKVLAFIKGRFANDYIRAGFKADVVDAAVSVEFDDVIDCLLRIKSIQEIRKDDAFKVLAASYKRVKNIIKDNSDSSVNADLFENDAEKNLYSLFLDVQKEMDQLIAKKDYTLALKAMLKMKEPVDLFFDEVMVMAEDQAVRQNRLNLLTALGELIRQIGDISKIQES